MVALTCYHDIVDIFRTSPLGQVIINSANVIDVQITALWLAEEARIVLDCVSFCWCVDNGEHLFQVVLDQLIEVREIQDVEQCNVTLHINVNLETPRIFVEIMK